MAIKISNTTVIDDTRNFVGVGLTVTGAIYANTDPGTAGQVLKSTGTGVEWGQAATSAAFAETVGLLGL